MLIKTVTRNIKDVFIGEGWENWARVNLSQNKVVSSSIKVTPNFERIIINKVRSFISKH